MTTTSWLAFIVGAYLCGSIPFGLLLARRRGIDIRAHGSGNIGATNVMRVLGRRAGTLCFALDVAKGLLPGLIAGLASGLVAGHLRALTGEGPTPDSWQSLWWLGVAAGAICGHMFPVWLGFKGGKGVATGFGAMLGLFPIMTIAALGALGVWIASVKVTRYVGVSSCLAAASLPLIVLGLSFIGEGGPSRLWAFLAAGTCLATLVIVKHRGNLRRTLAGTEPKVGQKKTA